MDSSSPNSVKGYDLLEQLGEGAYGAVYRAHQPLVEREVAVKVILPQYANQPDFIRRFETEAQLVAQLEHIHIVPLYDYWRDPDGAYLVMRLMKGGSLAETLNGSGPWEPEAAASLVDQLASALDAAHQKGVVHRDLKPANILLDEQGNAYLSDFGIAKELGAEAEATQTGAILGTPAYITPEQVQSLPVTPQTDIYALGVLLYQLLVGDHPFPDSSNAELVVKHLQEALPYVREARPELPAALDGVIQRATAKDPADRYPDAVSLAVDFRRALQLEGELPEVPEEEMYNPYKGLRAFQISDADDFFGREALTGQLLAHLASPGAEGRFLAVVGPSGSGKSSVVKAGLVPALRKGALPGSEQWFTAEMHPGAQPVNELALALLSISANPGLDLFEQLNQGGEGLLQAARSTLPDSESELLLVIDQFEELFSLVEDESGRDRFLELIHNAVSDEDSRVRVVLTLRADFYDRPLMHPDFGRLVEEHTVVVLPLNPQELGQAIQRPAERAGAVLEKDLVTTIIEDVVDQPGALPLLQYALTELFERREGRMLTNQAYRDIGGVLGALGRRAEEVYAGLDPAGKDTARQLFLRLVTLGEGAEDTRRRVLRAELEALTPNPSPIHGRGDHGVRAVLESFGRARLLSFDHDPATRGPTVEVAHEALLREWRRLREWLDESRADIRMQVVLRDATAAWLEGGEESSYLLRGSRLAQFEVWSEETSLAMTADEGRFLEASLAFEAERKAQQAALERRSRNFLRALVVVFAVAAIVAVGLTIFAFNQQGIAQDNAATAVAEADARATQQIIAENEAEARATQQAIAEAAQGEAELQAGIAAENEAEALAQKAIVEEQALAAQRQAELNKNRFLVAESQIALQGNNYDLALALANEAIQIENPPAAAELAFAQAAYSGGIYPARDFTGHQDEMYGLGFTPDGRSLVTVALDNTIRKWDLQSGQETAQMEIPGGQIAGWYAAAVSPDGSQVLAALEDLSLVLVDVESGQLIHRLAGHDNSIVVIKFSPDGKMALTGSMDRNENSPSNLDFSMRLWDLETGEEMRRFEGHSESVQDVVFMPDGRTALSASWDGSMIRWDLETGEMLQKMVNENEDLYLIGAVAITQDGRRAIANEHFKVNLWDLESGQLIGNLGTHNVFPLRMAVSPDGRMGVSGDVEGEIRVWDLVEGKLRFRFQGHSAPVTLLSFSEDGQHLFSGAGDKLRMWSLKNGAERRRFVHEGPVRGVAYSPDGRTAISVEQEDALHLWEIETGSELLRIQLPNDAWDVAYTPDGTSALVTFFNSDVIQYDLSTGAEMQRLGGKDENDGHLEWVDAVEVRPDGVTALSGSQSIEGRSLFLWDLESGEALMEYEAQEVYGLDISPDGGRALVVDDGLIELNLETGEEIRRLDGHENLVVDVEYSPDGKTALTSSWDSTLILWDLESGEIIHRLRGHFDHVRQLAIHPDGKTAISGSRDGTLILWDLERGEEIRRYLGHSAQINDLAFSPDGGYALSTDSEGLMIEWRIDDTLEELVTWAEANRSLRELTCTEREQFNIEPLCE